MSFFWDTTLFIGIRTSAALFGVVQEGGEDVWCLLPNIVACIPLHRVSSGTLESPRTLLWNSRIIKLETICAGCMQFSWRVSPPPHVVNFSKTQNCKEHGHKVTVDCGTAEVIRSGQRTRHQSCIGGVYWAVTNSCRFALVRVVCRCK
jgi:hypothetical protein